ncbi:MAG: DNA polymerase domain-containing protein, partial [Candidatus Hodarchaeales archaeon]
PVTLVNPAELDEKLEFRVSLIDKILNEKVLNAGFKNDNYWLNDGTSISKSSKSLIQFEQDGPYDFQFVMGKKKYIVYNHLAQDNKWEEEEITGLESKRADFSKLQKHFQEEILKAYLEQFNPDNPISLDQMYQNAFKASDRIRNEVLEGNLDPSYFVKPKALNKNLNEYKSKLPQVTAAYILKDLGYSIDPGIRIQMVNIKGNHVIPAQVFDFDFKKVKSVFIKHGICTLSFMLDELTSIEDIKQLIDTKQYLKDIYDPGRIFDRMIQFPMKNQQIKTEIQNTLDIQEIIDAENEKNLKQDFEERDDSIIHSPIAEEEIPKPRPVHLTTKSNLHKAKKKKGKFRPQSLDTIFNFPKATETKPRRPRNKTKIVTKSVAEPESQKPKVSSEKELETSKSELAKGSQQNLSLVSTDEIEELEKTDMFTNGHENGEESSFEQVDAYSEEEIVCSQCGTFISLNEVEEEGCIYCDEPTKTE